METLFKDIRYAVRSLLKRPGFTAIAVITLALGIGANTAIFSVVNAVLLRALPFADSEGLMLLSQTNVKSNFPQTPFSFPNFTDVKEQNQSFAQVGAWSSYNDTRFNLAGEPEPEQIQGALVSANFFSILGVKPVAGRTFLPEEVKEGGPRVAVLSHGLWQRRFSSSRDLLGKTLTLDGEGYTIIGVMPSGFAFPKFPQAADVWLALSRDPDPTLARKYARGATFLSVVGRLKPEVIPQQAQIEMDVIAHRLEQAYPHFNTGLGVKLVPLRQQVVGDLRRGLLVLLGAVGFVLLIACANVANLILARASTREKEIAIRIALGASRRRIVRQLLTECVLLAMIGGAMGLLLAQWLVALVAVMPYHTASVLIPYTISPDQIRLDGPVLGFTLVLSLLTGIVFGLAPALQVSKPDLLQTIKEGSANVTGAWRHHRVCSLLVVSEIALSLVLLAGAGLMIKSFMRLLEVDPGFRPENVLTAEIKLPRSQYGNDQQVATFHQQVLERVSALPGVRAAGAASALPLTGTDQGSDFFIEGQPPPPPEKENDASYRAISSDYFQAMGMQLLQGRSFTERDDKDSARVAIINESMARRFWPGENALGKRLALSLEALKFPAPNRPPVFDIPSAMREIVGVVKDVRHNGLDIAPESELYLPCRQRSAREMSLVVRATDDPTNLAAAVRREVFAVNKDQPLANVRTMSQLLSNSVGKPRFNFLLLAVFAGVAVLLAAVGVYGVMSYFVTQRTREIGIRMALGAEAMDVLKLVLRSGMTLALTGVTIGLVGAFALTRLITSLLFGVTPTDATTFIAVSFGLIAVALLACYIPARRATKVDPLVALRYE